MLFATSLFATVLLAALPMAVVLSSDARPDVPGSMLPTGAPLEHARGVAFSTHGDRPVPNCSWRYWYLQHSKKVWFRIDRRAVAGLRPMFTYEGQPILHRSEVASAGNFSHYTGRAPVVWGDFPGRGWGQGPGDTRLYLELWTRWTWLHPEACGHPERFGVDFFRAGETSPGAG